MTLHQLYERAFRQGIEIDERQMQSVKAMAFPEGWIAIDRRRYKNEREFKCDIAHELGHIETGAFYNIYSPFDLREKCEHKANKRAAEILMPLEDVQRAMRRGYVTAWALAEWFDVTQDFAEMALNMYEGELIQDREQEQLVKVLARFGLKYANQ